MKYTRENPFLAQLNENRLLTEEASSKETRHIVVDISDSDLTYSCGDSLGVWPSHCPKLVDALLSAMQAKGTEKVTLPNGDSAALREALSKHYALSSPTAKTLKALLKKTTNEREKKQLQDLLSPENKEEQKQFLADREYIDLLEEFPNAQFSPQEFVALLRKLTPRLYSIASSPLLFPSEVHLTVAIVRYQTNGRSRSGVASTYLADRISLNTLGVPVYIAHSSFDLPASDAGNIIMVGPGTGIAPFRSFIQERVARNAQGRSWLFFGDRNQATDFLYQEEWEAHLAKGELTHMDNAWSRDQGNKVYVQDKLLENAEKLWSWLKNGAYFYVCGDAKNMAKAVDEALQSIVQEQGSFSEKEAKDFIRELKKQKRYQRDVY